MKYFFYLHCMRTLLPKREIWFLTEKAFHQNSEQRKQNSEKLLAQKMNTSYVECRLDRGMPN